jgi:hypothetical protein
MFKTTNTEIKKNKNKNKKMAYSIKVLVHNQTESRNDNKHKSEECSKSSFYACLKPDNWVKKMVVQSVSEGS